MSTVWCRVRNSYQRDSGAAHTKADFIISEINRLKINPRNRDGSPVDLTGSKVKVVIFSQFLRILLTVGNKLLRFYGHRGAVTPPPQGWVPEGGVAYVCAQTAGELVPNALRGRSLVWRVRAQSMHRAKDTVAMILRKPNDVLALVCLGMVGWCGPSCAMLHHANQVRRPAQAGQGVAGEQVVPFRSAVHDRRMASSHCCVRYTARGPTRVTRAVPPKTTSNTPNGRLGEIGLK